MILSFSHWESIDTEAKTILVDFLDFNLKMENLLNVGKWKQWDWIDK